MFSFTNTINNVTNCHEEKAGETTNKQRFTVTIGRNVATTFCHLIAPLMIPIYMQMHLKFNFISSAPHDYQPAVSIKAQPIGLLRQQFSIRQTQTESTHYICAATRRTSLASWSAAGYKPSTQSQHFVTATLCIKARPSRIKKSEKVFVQLGDTRNLLKEKGEVNKICPVAWLGLESWWTHQATRRSQQVTRHPTPIKVTSNLTSLYK